MKNTLNVTFLVQIREYIHVTDVYRTGAEVCELMGVRFHISKNKCGTGSVVIQFA